MNIRVDFNTSIMDGTEAVFRSPVDCSQITGLIVYYKENGSTASKEFALADAHGNNVGDIDHLFAENVVVKVILDVTTGMAFVQNADTNAYLEGRFDKLIEQLCPAINETGTVVQCEPLEGYPLTITAKSVPNACKITVCGKNLYNSEEYGFKDGYYVNKGNGLLAGGGTHTEYCATELYIPVAHLRGMTINLNNTPGGNAPGMAFYDSEKKLLAGGKGNNQIVPENAVYMRFSTYISKKDEAQIELGSVATEYEGYKVHGTGTLDDSSDAVVVSAGAGVNTVFGINANDGSALEITVTGRADPVAIIESQNDRIAALEKSLTALLEG